MVAAFWALWYYILFSFDFVNVSLLLVYIAFLFLMPKFIKFRSVDDAISLSILAAIWFSFIENIIYFWYKWEAISQVLQISSILHITAWELVAFLGFVFIRVSVVTMIHVLCSWVFGYHFWLAHFAKPELVRQVREWRKSKIIDFFHNTLNTAEDKVFMYEQLAIALFISIWLHWIYDLIVQINATVFWLPLIVLVMPWYFFWWFIYLFSLLEDRNNKRNIWVLEVKEEYIKDEKNNL